MHQSESIEQGSDAWYAARLGFISGSRFYDAITMDKSGKRYLAGRATLITEVTLEILTGAPAPMWTSKATAWGKEHEPFARIAYEARSNVLCQEVGFIKHPVHAMVGVSPDGLIEDDGGWEAKCPLTTGVHLDTLLNGMPEEHMPQVQGAMWVTGRKWHDFVSFHPLFPEHMQLYIQRIHRDDAYIRMMEERVLSAIDEIHANIDRLRKKYLPVAQQENV